MIPPESNANWVYTPVVPTDCICQGEHEPGEPLVCDGCFRRVICDRGIPVTLKGWRYFACSSKCLVELMERERKR